MATICQVLCCCPGSLLWWDDRFIYTHIRSIDKFWVVEPSSRHELFWENECIIARWVNRINKIKIQVRVLALSLTALIPYGFCSFFLTSEKEAKKVEGFDTIQKPSYYIRLGSLSTKLRSRAYQQALSRVKEAKQKSQETISQLHSTVKLVSRTSFKDI